MRSAFTFAALLFLGLSVPARADYLAVWNFNDAVNNEVSAANTARLFSVDRGTGTMSSTFQFTPATGTPTQGITAFSGSTLNAFPGDVAGQALGLQEGAGIVNAGASLTFGTSTFGFNNIIVSLAIQKTATGFDSNQFQYSLNGSTYTNFGAAFNPATSFAVQSFDLSGIAGLANNALASFRIVFNNANNTPSAAGNNRIDNITINGSVLPNAVPEPASLAMVGLGALVLVVARRRLRAA